MQKQSWKQCDTVVYFGDGGIDLHGAPDPVNRAQLIASAPVLLAALELIKDNVWPHIERNMTSAEIAQIDAAIAAARGTV